MNSSQQANFSRLGGGTGYAPPPPDPRYDRAVQTIYEPGGWKKVQNAAGVLTQQGLSYLNQIREFNGARPLGVPANFEQSFNPIDYFPGGAGVSVLRATSQTAVRKAAMTGIVKAKAKNSALRITPNAATEAATASYLTKFVQGLTNPRNLGRVSAGVVVGGVMASIGTYPFAGFIKEEALQTLSMASSTALRNNDLEGAEQALAMQDEILNPDLWEKIIDSVPFVNVIDNLKEFYEAAALKTSIDRKILADMQRQGSSSQAGSVVDRDKYFETIRTEQDEQERSVIDYYNSERMKLLEWENQARKEQRESEARFWAEQRAQKRKEEEEDRKAIAEFWFQYRKRLQELQDNSRPSKLNFGLL